MNDFELFLYDEESQEILINNVVVMFIPTFKKLMEKELINTAARIEANVDKPSTKIILFIYLLDDPRSPLAALDLDSREEKAKGICKIRSDWKISKEVEKGRIEYGEYLKLHPIGRAYLTTAKSLINMSESIEAQQDTSAFLKRQLIERVNLLRAKESGIKEKDLALTEAETLLNKLTSVEKDIITNNNLMPKLATSLEDLKMKFADKINEEKELYGGRSKGRREDPN